MEDRYDEGRRDAYKEILDSLTDANFGGRTEAYEATVDYLRDELSYRG